MTPQILQFGTSRFLQAHVDLFVSQAMAAGQALGGIAVVQTTRSAESAARVATLSAGAGYPVRVRGMRRSLRSSGRCQTPSSTTCNATVCGPTRWSTASSSRPCSRWVRWPNRMRCGPSSASPAWCCPARTRPWW